MSEGDRGNIVLFSGITRLDMPADQILECAIGELDRVVVIGYHKDWSEYFASSIADGGEVNWLLDRFKLMLLKKVDEMSGDGWEGY